MSKPAPRRAAIFARRRPRAQRVRLEPAALTYNAAQCNGLRLLSALASAPRRRRARTTTTKAVRSQFPFGAAKYNHSLVYCACNACRDTVRGRHVRRGPECGMVMQATSGDAGPSACNTCMNGGCCAEQDAMRARRSLLPLRATRRPRAAIRMLHSTSVSRRAGRPVQRPVPVTAQPPSVGGAVAGALPLLVPASNAGTP